MEGVQKYMQANDYMYQVAYWHTISTIAKFYPNQSLELALTKDNSSFIFSPPKKLQNKIIVFSWKYISFPPEKRKKLAKVTHILQDVSQINKSYSLIKEPTILDETHNFNKQTKTNLVEKKLWVEISWDLFLSVSKCKPIKDAMENMQRMIEDYPIKDWKRLEKELNYLMLYYQPLLRKCLLIS